MVHLKLDVRTSAAVDLRRMDPDLEPDDGLVDDASRTLERLQARVASARAELATLRGEVARVRDELKGLRAAQLQEADEELVQAAARADTVAQVAVSSLGELTGVTQHDELTGAPTRTLLLDRLESAIAQAQRRSTRVGVLFVDLDHFKQINDTLGHAVGDQVLQLVAQRLRSAVRESDTVSRHGGDEFLVLLPEISTAADAASVARKMLAAIGAPARIGPHTLDLSASVGIAVYPEDGGGPANLIQRADASMYRSKQRARGTFTFHADGDDNGSSEAAPPIDLAVVERRTDSALAQHEARLRELSQANHELLAAAQVAQRLKIHAETAHRRQIDFVAKAAHAMRTPLSVIMLTASALSRSPTTSKGHDSLKRHAAHLSRLIDDLLDGSLVGGGEFRLHRDAVDLDAIVAAAADACRPALEAKAQRLSVVSAPGAKMLHGDSMRLAQVLNNLLINASRRAPQSGEIRLTTAVSEGLARIGVGDDGMAIAPEDLPRLFDLFATQAQASDDDPGLGIGLAVVQELVRAHGGTVEAIGPCDRPGVEFVVTLPLLGAPVQPRGVSAPRH
jgi:diguanylate cyclase (GGDEF)-like protein